MVIGQPEVCDCDRMVIGHDAEIPAIEVSVIGCDFCSLAICDRG